jgi:hypothetical protein
MTSATQFDLAEAIAVLERTPHSLRALLHGLPEPWYRADEGPETFTAFDNIGHLIHGERADWIPRARIILQQGEDTRFAAFDRFAHVHESAGKDLATLLDELCTLREQNLATLRGWNLTPSDLELTGEHPALGRVTLRQLLATWVVHDLGHMAQVARVMAKRYATDVGPWREYLPILGR